jgi:hypothetical protein
MVVNNRVVYKILGDKRDVNYTLFTVSVEWMSYVATSGKPGAY